MFWIDAKLFSPGYFGSLAHWLVGTKENRKSQMDELFVRINSLVIGHWSILGFVAYVFEYLRNVVRNIKWMPWKPIDEWVKIHNLLFDDAEKAKPDASSILLFKLSNITILLFSKRSFSICSAFFSSFSLSSKCFIVIEYIKYPCGMRHEISF